MCSNGLKLWSGHLQVVKSIIAISLAPALTVCVCEFVCISECVCVQFCNAFTFFLGYVSILLRSEVRSENIHGSGNYGDPVMLLWTLERRLGRSDYRPGLLCHPKIGWTG